MYLYAVLKRNWLMCSSECFPESRPMLIIRYEIGGGYAPYCINHTLPKYLISNSPVWPTWAHSGCIFKAADEKSTSQFISTLFIVHITCAFEGIYYFFNFFLFTRVEYFNTIYKAAHFSMQSSQEHSIGICWDMGYCSANFLWAIFFLLQWREFLWKEQANICV